VAKEGPGDPGRAFLNHPEVGGGSGGPGAAEVKLLADSQMLAGLDPLPSFALSKALDPRWQRRVQRHATRHRQPQGHPRRRPGRGGGGGGGGLCGRR